MKIVYFDTPVETCRERIRNRMGHPTLAEDRIHQAMALFTSRLEIPKPEECDELIYLV